MVGWLAMWPCEERVCFSTFIISSIFFFLFYFINHQFITNIFNFPPPSLFQLWNQNISSIDPNFSLFARNFCLVLCNLFNPLRIEEQLLQPISPKVCSVSFLGLFLSLFGIVFFLSFFLFFSRFHKISKPLMFLLRKCMWVTMILQFLLLKIYPSEFEFMGCLSRYELTVIWKNNLLWEEICCAVILMSGDGNLAAVVP